MKLLEKLNNLKKSKKGFTLVELVVVIVILAVMAAILIPNFLNYMNKAQDSQKHVQARSVYLAASTVAAEKSYVGLPDSITSAVVNAAKSGDADDTAWKIKELVGTEVSGDKDFIYTIHFTEKVGTEGNKVTNIKVVYDLTKIKDGGTIPTPPTTTPPTTPAE